MTVQWFPGHMTKAKKDFEKNLKYNDLVIEVVDARLPQSSENPMLNQIIKNRAKPHLKLLNKSDIADEKVTQQWINFFQNLFLLWSCDQETIEPSYYPSVVKLIIM